MITIRDCTAEDIPVIQNIAERTWWPVYTPILSVEQIRFMLDTIYGEQSLKNAMDEKSQHFILLTENDVAHGFASYGFRPGSPQICKLHKIYVLPETHGKGFGKMLIEEIKNRLIPQSVHTLELNVNRYNPAKSFYERLGFRIIKEEDIPIGPYWMNDYVMRLQF